MSPTCFRPSSGCPRGRARHSAPQRAPQQLTPGRARATRPGRHSGLLSSSSSLPDAPISLGRLPRPRLGLRRDRARRPRGPPAAAGRRRRATSRSRSSTSTTSTRSRPSRAGARAGSRAWPGCGSGCSRRPAHAHGRRRRLLQPVRPRHGARRRRAPHRPADGGRPQRRRRGRGRARQPRVRRRRGRLPGAPDQSRFPYVSANVRPAAGGAAFPNVSRASCCPSSSPPATRCASARERGHPVEPKPYVVYADRPGRRRRDRPPRAADRRRGRADAPRLRGRRDGRGDGPGRGPRPGRARAREHPRLPRPAPRPAHEGRRQRANGLRPPRDRPPAAAGAVEVVSDLVPITDAMPRTRPSRPRSRAGSRRATPASEPTASSRRAS